jgi:hypothetical protein
MVPNPLPRLDRSALRIASLQEGSDERAYWWSRTPGERLLALETARQIIHGYDPAATRLERILEIAQLERR